MVREGGLGQKRSVCQGSCFVALLEVRSIPVGRLPKAMADTLAHFVGVDRTIDGFEGLEAAQNAISTDEKKDAFALDFKYLAKLWESLSPDSVLDEYNLKGEIDHLRCDLEEHKFHIVNIDGSDEKEKTKREKEKRG